MAITISVAEVKRKAMIDSGDTTYDSAITSLISEMQPALEYSVEDSYLDDTSNTKLQATLKLGMLEIISGEFLEQLRREIGAAEQFSVSGVSVGAATEKGADLTQQGATRLAPYLKCALPMMADTASTNSSEDDEMTFSADEEVW